MSGSMPSRPRRGGIRSNPRCGLEEKMTDFKFTLSRWVEFTLDMGCPNSCVYCPQKLLMSRYYENDGKRKSSMTLGDFKNILENIPKEVAIDFAGMGEPLINPEAVDMMAYAARKGHKVHLYTSLRGASPKQILRLKDLPISSFVLHLPDGDGLMKLKVDADYKKRLALFHSLNLPNVLYTCIGKVHSEIPGIIKVEPLETPIVSRAGTLDTNEMPEQVKLTRNFMAKTGKRLCRQPTNRR